MAVKKNSAGVKGWMPKAVALRCGLAGLLVLLSSGLRAEDVSRTSPKGRPFDAVLARIVATLISTQHYSKHPLDDKISQQLFDEYFATLDRDRRFFLASDIDEFAAYRTVLDNQVYAGQIDFAFAVYERFLQRVRERTEYVRQRLAEPFDFSLDEEVELDRRDVPWCATREELDEVWRKSLKNRLLVFTLMEQDGKSAPEEAPEGKPKAEEEPPATPLARKTPVERVLASQESFLSYLEDNDSVDVLEMFLSSLTRIYDPHSTYMAPSTEEDFDINMKLSLEGIGAVLSTEEGYVKIVDIIEGGPAERDGRLKPNDRIVAVAQANEEPVDVVDMPLRKVVRMIRGPKGSTVYLSVIEAGKALGSVPSTVDIVRDEVKLTEKGAKAEVKRITLPGEGANAGRQADVMVLKLPSFYSDFEGKRRGLKDYRSATRDVKQLLEKAVADGVEGVVLDLRSNGGGSLEEAISLAGLFFPDGPVVQVKQSGHRKEIQADKDGKTTYAGPLLVLVNRLSASASEIVAAAIQDHHRGVVVGDASTHGKGTVQTVFDLKRLLARDPMFRNEETGALKFTIAKFYRVNGESTQKRGVVPDVVYPAFTDHMEIGEASLEHALRWDEIEPLEISDQIDVTPYLGALKKRAEERAASSDAFADYRQSVERYGQLRARKTTTLNLEKRRELQKQEEKWLEQIRQQTFQGDDSEADDDGQSTPENAEKGEGGADTPDLILDQALAILGDLVWLQEGDLIAVPKADVSVSPATAAQD